MAFIPEDTHDFRDFPIGKSLYFASDFHLGAPTAESSRLREKKIVNWLDQVSQDAAAIYLVGDIFDFWFEYKKVIPKGFVRFQSKLLELRDRGIPVFIFTGNHDTWFFDYFPEEFDIPIYKNPISIAVGDQRFLVGHGDGLGPGDSFYKFLKKVFVGKLPQWLFRWLHPDIGVSLAHRWSRSSRISNTDKDGGFKSKEGEWLWQFAKEMEDSTHYDYYVFGHRHIPLDLAVNSKARYINLGEWVNHFTYLKYDGKEASLLTYTD